ncbi:MAG: hypothetical protein A2Y17_06355 [Clostridiales bacterium GWF2_38_85]|nr:MAG: hypothetical protein A2Y17_06355 [Clostridiales bacterium GWF2_38_85]HBL85515.1 hypothetical protein [Clostridiales bacterium]
MTKKILSIALTALLLVSMLTVFASADNTTMFTDFDSLTRFEKGVDITDLPDVTADEFKDFYADSYDSSEMTNKATLTIVDAKGVDGSKALEIKMPRQADNSNIAINLYASTTNNIPTSFVGADYLVLWVDFTGVDFRKACFGVFDSNHVLFRTDERDGISDLKFYTQDGNGGWTENLHGGDGCFGAAQESSLLDYKGWVAFPLVDFVSWDSNDAPFDADTMELAGVYFYFDYNGESYTDKPFYFDDIQFLADYTTADDVVADESEAESTVESTTSEETPAETGDNFVIFAILSVIALAGATLVARKSR